MINFRINLNIFYIYSSRDNTVEHKQLKTQWPVKLKSWHLILFITIWAKDLHLKMTTTLWNVYVNVSVKCLKIIQLYLIVLYHGLTYIKTQVNCFSLFLVKKLFFWDRGFFLDWDIENFIFYWIFKSYPFSNETVF